jgi:hypothetical protein
MSVSPTPFPESLFQRFGGSFFGILAPRGAAVPAGLVTVALDAELYASFIAAIQRFRGTVYVAESAIRPQDLDAEGRHQATADHESWHVFLLNADSALSGCVRITAYPGRVRSVDLRLYSLIARMEASQAARYEAAVQDYLETAYAAGYKVGEIGGMAVDESDRKTSRPLILIGACWALGQLMGGYRGLASTTARHRAATLLRRYGAYSLAGPEGDLPRFYDSYHGCDMEILAIDPQRTAPAVEPTVLDLRRFLASYFVIVP